MMKEFQIVFKRVSNRLIFTVALLVSAIALSATSTLADTSGLNRRAFAITASNQLISFNLDQPGQILSRVNITNLRPGEQLLGIDYRPATNLLYALGSSNQLYIIDTNRGSATRVGSPFTIPLEGIGEGTLYGFDFNPAADRIRSVASTGQDLRLHPDLGEVVAIDGRIAYDENDPNFGANPNVSGSAYTNPDNDPATGTTLYNIDSNLDVLTIQDPPNAGILKTVGSLGVDAGSMAGFDIFLNGPGVNVAVAVSQGSGAMGARLYLINLMTGQATDCGMVGSGEVITGLAVPTNQ